MKLFIVPLLLITSCAFAQYETRSISPPIQEHKGIYFSANPGFAYTTERRKVSYDVSEIESEKFSGFLHLVEFRIGRFFSNMASLYAVLGLGMGEGSFKGEYITKENGNEINKVTIKDDDDGTFRVSSGGGLEIYPVQDITGLMYGTFIGVNAGFELDYFKVTAYDFNQVYRDSSMVTGFINLFCKFEIGKEWRMNRLWNYGFALNYTISWLRDKNEHYSYTKVRKSADRISHKSHTFGLTFRLSH